MEVFDENEDVQTDKEEEDEFNGGLQPNSNLDSQLPEASLHDTEMNEDSAPELSEQAKQTSSKQKRTKTKAKSRSKTKSKSKKKTKKKRQFDDEDEFDDTERLPKANIPGLTEEGEWDLSRVTLRDIIKFGARVGKPTKATLEREVTLMKCHTNLDNQGTRKITEA
jgi:hypothetical protein